jgi:choline dehydrogenase-like flavoprotein
MDTTIMEMFDGLAPNASVAYALQAAYRYLWHEAGTCAMGRTPRDSVTDRYGGVWGTPRLFIADASVMPTALGTYPTLTLVALALRTAAHIAAGLAHGGR